ncbi:Fe-S-containing hydro-lyase [Candidatus Formimonas warabiya]|uniref:Fumarate hydratase n=1 Tax=Formimonas warabiya TaxID=1761012 RepID=A0A3G1KPQ2_FORW1|nr:Fe-S-containing hydro-lyase [Candidatus Formimonas warabiya]ATW24410.1 fumarate hydratase [Candidatus Formimonas warabiya]ATW26076.1 fumarate hydratase [Candidatus Formimonas warabiya]
MAVIHLTTPLTEADLQQLRIGDQVYLNGIIYTGRDAAHKRLADLMRQGQNLPLDLNGQVIYYVGPSPAKPGRPIGSAGPTTSYRMDAYAPLLMEKAGLKGMIGKGMRNTEVKQAMQKHKAVYFGATGGAAALIAQSIKAAEIILYAELGPEAVRKLTVENLPLTVINDIHGGDLYQEGVKQYRLD